MNKPMELIKIDTDHYELDGIKVTDRLSEVKELLGEVDMEKLYYKLQDDFIDEHDDIFHYYSFVKGYTQALEDNKAKRYTEEDLKYIFECGRNYQNNAEITFKVSMEYLLQTKTSWQVEIVDGKLKLKGI